MVAVAAGGPPGSGRTPLPSPSPALPSPALPSQALPSQALPSQVGVLAKAGSENFPVATRLLPARLRSHLLAVYGYARFVDDVGDDPAGTAEQRLAALERIDADLDRLYAGEPPELPAVRGLAPTVAACAIPRAPLARLVEANRRDQRTSRYPSFSDLVEYCTFSADPVGELVLHVFGAATLERVALSDRVCTALQVLEHCQDVGEDFRRGRVYLPAADLAAAGASEADLAAASASPALREVVRRQVERARRLLDEGAPLVSQLPGLAAVAVAGYLAGGRATAAALARAGYDVLGHDVRPAKGRVLAEWMRLCGRALLRSRR